MNHTFCGADFTLGRSCEDAPPTCGGDSRGGFVGRCWDEGPRALTPCGMTGEDCSCDGTSLVATGGMLSVVFALQQLPIGHKD